MFTLTLKLAWQNGSKSCQVALATPDGGRTACDCQQAYDGWNQKSESQSHHSLFQSILSF